MQDLELINLWKSYDKKLEEILILNKESTREITRIKVRSFLNSMSPLKIFTILVGFVWIFFVDILIANLFFVANPIFLASAGFQALLTKLALGIYLYQLILIHQSDIGEPIVETQQKLAKLRSSTLWSARFLFLQLPAWTTFYWNESMFKDGNIWLTVIQIIVTVSFSFLATWLFFNIRYKNRNKKWFRFIFNGEEWNPVMKSMALLEEIKEYKDPDLSAKKID